jgi:hypothetical protein
VLEGGDEGADEELKHVFVAQAKASPGAFNPVFQN